MPRPRRNARRGRAHGASLIELLVVVAILAVLAASVTLSVDAVGAPRVLEREARRIEALVSLACERAQMSGHDYGVHLATASYSFSVFMPAGWRVETRADLRPRDLPSGVTLSAWREDIALELGEDLPEAPQVVCFASGEMSPFELELAAGSAREGIRGEPDASVRREALR